MYSYASLYRENTGPTKSKCTVHFGFLLCCRCCGHYIGIIISRWCWWRFTACAHLLGWEVISKSNPWFSRLLLLSAVKLCWQSAAGWDASSCRRNLLPQPPLWCLFSAPAPLRDDPTLSWAHLGEGDGVREAPGRTHSLFWRQWRQQCHRHRRKRLPLTQQSCTVLHQRRILSHAWSTFLNWMGIALLNAFLFKWWTWRLKEYKIFMIWRKWIQLLKWSMVEIRIQRESEASPLVSTWAQSYLPWHHNLVTPLLPTVL